MSEENKNRGQSSADRETDELLESLFAAQSDRHDDGDAAAEKKADDGVSEDAEDILGEVFEEPEAEISDRDYSDILSEVLGSDADVGAPSDESGAEDEDTAAATNADDGDGDTSDRAELLKKVMAFSRAAENDTPAETGTVDLVDAAVKSSETPTGSEEEAEKPKDPGEAAGDAVSADAHAENEAVDTDVAVDEAAEKPDGTVGIDDEDRDLMLALGYGTDDGGEMPPKPAAGAKSDLGRHMTDLRSDYACAFGYRGAEYRDIPVIYPFGYGLSYASFRYENLEIEKTGETSCRVSYDIYNDSDFDAKEISEVYVGDVSARVLRPVKELKGFSKVFLKAGEEKTVTIKFDDKTFRYWNMKTNKWEVEGGVYSIMIGASCADIRLQDSLAIIGTTEVMPYYTNRVSSYVEGKIQQIGNEEYETILGHSIPDGSWSGELGMNDALCQMYYAKSGIARFICKKLGEKLKKSEAAGIPDLNTLFQYNMPFRAIAKMTGGMVSMEMVEGLLKVVNGHFSGLGKVISGFFRNQKLNKQYEKDLEEQK